LYEKKFMGILPFWSWSESQTQKRVLLLTGSPGVGKTTVIAKAVTILREKGFSVGGMFSREVREGGVRVGFEISDLSSQKCGWLAHVNQKSGLRVGRYCVNLEDLEDVGAQAITFAVETCDVIAIDEVGPMELFSEKFKAAVKNALESTKLVIAVIHWKARDRLISYVKSMEEAETIMVTADNRESLSEILAEKAARIVRKS
jgi:nucleoside-triphosphatase